MSKDKPNIDTEKNKLSNSEVSAGKNVHIGDVYTTIQNIQGVKKGDGRVGRKGNFIGFVAFSKFIGIAIIPMALVGIFVLRFYDSENNTASKPALVTPVIASVKAGTNETAEKGSVGKKVEPKPVESNKPTTAVNYINTLSVKTNSEKYRGLFTAHISQMLRSANIKYQQDGKGNIANRIECIFDLQETKTKIGGREAFSYSPTLEVTVYGNTGQSCFSGFYSSAKNRVGYAEDSEAIIRKKIIEPSLTEINNEFENNLPTLCKVN